MTGSNSELARVEASWNELKSLVDSLGPEGLELTGQDGWAVKDHLAHIAAWEHSLIALLEKRDRVEAMGLHEPTGDTDAVNRSLWELHRMKTPDQALAYFRDAHSSLVRTLGKLTDADLRLPYNDHQPDAPRDAADNRPVGDWVAGNTYEHYAEHVGWINQIRESSTAR